MKSLLLSTLLLLGIGAQAQSSPITESYFGMMEHNISANGWPQLPVGIFRTWDVFPNVTWRDIEPNAPVGNLHSYNWGNLDALVNLVYPHGVDILYTFGKTPAWASSNPTGACGTGATPQPAGSCYPPANFANLTAFANAIAVRYNGKIKYWETWNEPSNCNVPATFWYGCGSAASKDDMSSMASVIYSVIKTVNSANQIVSPAAQGKNAYNWLEGYLARPSNPGQYADIFAFHGYVFAGDLEDETIYASAIESMKTTKANHGFGSKELWDTEDSWGKDTSYPNGDLEAAWVLRHLLIGYAHGLKRIIWDAWSDNTFGTLFNKTGPGPMCQSGKAYKEFHDWILGTSFTDSCSAVGTVWRCNLQTSDGHLLQIVWDRAKIGFTGSQILPANISTCNLAGTPPAGTSVSAGSFTNYSAIDGTGGTVSGTISVTAKPVLLFGPSVTVGTGQSWEGTATLDGVQQDQ